MKTGQIYHSYLERIKMYRISWICGYKIILCGQMTVIKVGGVSENHSCVFRVFESSAMKILRFLCKFFGVYLKKAIYFRIGQRGLMRAILYCILA